MGAGEGAEAGCTQARLPSTRAARRCPATPPSLQLPRTFGMSHLRAFWGAATEARAAGRAWLSRWAPRHDAPGSAGATWQRQGAGARASSWPASARTVGSVSAQAHPTLIECWHALPERSAHVLAVGLALARTHARARPLAPRRTLSAPAEPAPGPRQKQTAGALAATVLVTTAWSSGRVLNDPGRRHRIIVLGRRRRRCPGGRCTRRCGTGAPLCAGLIDAPRAHTLAEWWGAARLQGGGTQLQRRR